VLNVGLLVFVEVNLEESGSVKANPDSLSNNLGRVDQVIENGVVDGHQCA
jgi:hypothetical protein